MGEPDGDEGETGDADDAGVDRGEGGAGLDEKFDEFERARLAIAEQEPAQAAAIAAYNEAIAAALDAYSEASAPFNAALDEATGLLQSITWDIAVAAQAARDRGDAEEGLRLDDWMSSLEEIGECMILTNEFEPEELRVPRPPISETVAGLPRRSVDVVQQPAGDRAIDPEVRKSVGSSWRRIDAWLARAAPHLAGKMTPPASPEAIAATEMALGVELPAAVRASYLVHDGDGGLGLFPAGDCLSLEQMQQQHATWKSLCDQSIAWHGEIPLPRGVQRAHYHLGWIPLVDWQTGDHTVIDLVPAEGGTFGQLVDFGHESGPECIAAPGLAEYLAYLADGLEAGAVDVEERYIEWHRGQGVPRSGFAAPPAAPGSKAAPRSPASMEMSTARYYFELREGTPGQFWEVAQVGTKLITRSGKIGNKGRTTTKTYKFAKVAAWELAQIINKKTGEGCVEGPHPG